MVRIAFVSDTLHTFFGSELHRGTGGAERQQALLIRALQDRNYSIAVVTLKHSEVSSRPSQAVEIHPVIPDVRGSLKAPYKLIRTFYGLHEVGADIYYVRGNDFLSLATAIYTRINGRGFVYAVANDANVHPTHLRRLGAYKKAHMWAIHSADRVVSQTDFQTTLLKEAHGVTPVQIPNGYDVPPKTDLVPHSLREFVLWVGSMDPTQKKPRRFLHLARQLPDVEFRMIGPPDNDHPKYYDEIKSEAREIVNLEFVGYVEPDDIHHHYRKAMAVVNTSDYEGFPNVFLEAWRYATPVVSLYYSLDDVFGDQGVGIRAGGMDELIETVAHLVSDESLRNTLGYNGRDLMKDEFSIENLVDKYDQLFQNIWAGKSVERE